MSAAPGRTGRAAKSNRRPGTRIGECLECGGEFEAGPTAEFCSPKCRKAFHNRRMMRGAELYDVYMVIRFDRPRAKLLGLWTILSRLASTAREEDRRQRAGRRSWRRPEVVLGDKPFLRATGRGKI